METLIVLGIVIAVIVLARAYYRDTSNPTIVRHGPATGVSGAPRRITSDDFEIVRREASCD